MAPKPRDARYFGSAQNHPAAQTSHEFGDSPCNKLMAELDRRAAAEAEGAAAKAKAAAPKAKAAAEAAAHPTRHLSSKSERQSVDI